MSGADATRPLDPRSAARSSPEKLTKVNLFDSPRVFVDVYTLLPGQSQAPHRHDDQDKLYFALAGAGLVTTGGAEHRLSEGQLVVCPAGGDHGLRNDGAVPLVALVAMTKAPR